MDKQKYEDEICYIVPTDKLGGENLDYSLIDKYITDWVKLSEMTRSVIMVFDCYTNKFVFVSENGLSPFGVTSSQLMENGHSSFMELIHPDDINYGFSIRKKIYSFIENLPLEEQKQYKFIHEMRVRNMEGEYIRIIEQEQIIEFDSNGKAWLMLSVIDVDAGNNNEITRSHVYNFTTGKHIYPDLSDTLADPLTEREIEILGLMKKGFLSKEIAAKLNISINTVNSHRQNIFQKLDSNNAMEAVNHAVSLGIMI